MGNNFISKLISKNEAPILFIGSGMSIRYLENYPNWIGLLINIWKEMFKEGDLEDFYKFANAIRKEMKLEDNPETQYLIMPKIAEKLSVLVEEKFISGELNIKGLTQEDVFRKNILPIKKMVSNFFTNYVEKKDMVDEIKSFTNLLFKSQIIFTTNYDPFIENKLKEAGADPTIYIGQQGFFEEGLGYSEIYKIHGSFDDPNSILLTTNDYENFNNDSILITSKLIIKLIDNPIIFLGYSVSDPNIRNIIVQFTKSLNEDDINKFLERFIVVNRKEGEENLIVMNHYDRELGFTYTLIERDNYKLLFDNLSKINQGLSPSQIKKYYKLIKELIVTRSKEGNVDKLLLSYKNIDNYEEFTRNKKTVIAFGDEKYVFTVPTLSTYIKCFLEMEEEMLPEIALTFIARDISGGRIPLRKYYNKDLVDRLNISVQEKNRIENKLRRDN